MKSNVVQLHRYKDPAAYRPQPARGGSDFWPTIDRGLILALVYEVRPALPVGVIWEAAAGAGHLVEISLPSRLTCAAQRVSSASLSGSSLQYQRRADSVPS